MIAMFVSTALHVRCVIEVPSLPLLQDSLGEIPIHFPWTSDGDAPNDASVSEVMFTDRLLALLLIFGEALSFLVFMLHRDA